MRVSATLSGIAALSLLPASVMAAQAGVVPASQAACVNIGKPDPARRYVYRFRDSGGNTSEYENQWTEITDTGSRMQSTKRTGGKVSITRYVSSYRIADDVTMMQSYRSAGSDNGRDFDNTTRFSAPLVGDPFGRACADRVWTLRPVMATSISPQGTFSAATDPGQLRMLGIHEKVTVPAGTFDTVHYVRSTSSRAGAIRDEYWKSIEHGVVVKHESALPGATSSEILQAIR